MGNAIDENVHYNLISCLHSLHLTAPLAPAVLLLCVNETHGMKLKFIALRAAQVETIRCFRFREKGLSAFRGEGRENDSEKT